MAEQTASFAATKSLSLAKASDLKFTNAIYGSNVFVRSTKMKPMNTFCAFQFLMILFHNSPLSGNALQSAFP
jgi:hypothetical protein